MPLRRRRHTHTDPDAKGHLVGSGEVGEQGAARAPCHADRRPMAIAPPETLSFVVADAQLGSEPETR